MTTSKLIYIDTRPGFGIFSAPDDECRGKRYRHWLEKQFNKSNAIPGVSSYWGLAQQVNKLEYQLKNEKALITVIGTQEQAFIAYGFLQAKLPGFSDSIILLSGSLND